MKATLARLGIRGFNPKLKKAVERLDTSTRSERTAAFHDLCFQSRQTGTGRLHL
jgi:hypothetical protein